MTHSSPPWLDRLNAMQRDWRLQELLDGRNPDPALERYFGMRDRWLPRGEGITGLHNALN